MARAEKQDCRDRILDAAERLFGELGFAGVSMRHLVQEAGVNLATVYYYFGSKEGLMEAVLKRRFDPLRREQLELLDQNAREAGGRALAVEKVLEAMLRPPLQLALSAPAQHQAVARLIGRIVTELNPQARQVVRNQHAPVRTAFFEAMHRSLPALRSLDLRWRLEFVWGALAFILCNPNKVAGEGNGDCGLIKPQQVVEEMIRFFAPGFRTPGRRARPARRERRREVRDGKSND